MKNKTTHYTAILLLLVAFGLLAVGSRGVSITTDEMFNVAQGYAFLSQGTDSFWMFQRSGQPHFLQVLETGLLYISRPDIPVESLDAWGVWLRPFVADFAYRMFGLERAQMGWYLFELPSENVQPHILARLPTMFLAIILGALIFRWCRELWGARSSLLALFLFVFDLNFLAHARLSGTDAGTAVVGTAALYTAWRWTERPLWRWSLATGILTGAILLSKASGVLWAFAIILIMIGNTIFRYSDHMAPLLLQGVVTASLSMIVVWASYGFTVGYVQGIPFPVPAPVHWEQLLFQTNSVSERLVFALGHRSSGRLWWYFPLAFLIKNPLPFLIALIASTVILIHRQFRPLTLFTLGFFPFLYTTVAIFQGMNIGYRHLLPVHSFLYMVIAAGLGQLLQQRKHWPRWVVFGLSGWLILETVGAFPNEIAYFNQLVGGSRQGYRYLADSNVEWGQSSHLLYAYVEDHPEVILEPPEHRLFPEAGRYVVNAAQLQGTNITDRYAYEWFRYREPTGRVNETLLIYDVASSPIAWLAQCTTPDAPLAPEMIEQEIAPRLAHSIYFDCTGSWLYPGGGETAGLYALHHDLVGAPVFDLRSFYFHLPPPDDGFIARRLAGASVSFNHELDEEGLPAFVLYEAPEGTVPAPPSSPAYPSSVETPPEALNGTPLTDPIPLEGGLAFLGSAAYPTTGQLEVETWWSVVEGPITRPLSIMAHLLGPGGHPLGVADGLDISPLILQPGDVLVQRHVFPTQPEGAELWLRTGVYWVDPVENWRTPTGSNAIFVPLSPAEME